MRQPPVLPIQPKQAAQRPASPARSTAPRQPTWRNQGEETTAQLSRLLRGKLPR